MSDIATDEKLRELCGCRSNPTRGKRILTTLGKLFTYLTSMGSLYLYLYRCITMNHCAIIYTGEWSLNVQMSLCRHTSNTLWRSTVISTRSLCVHTSRQNMPVTSLSWWIAVKITLFSINISLSPTKFQGSLYHRHLHCSIKTHLL